MMSPNTPRTPEITSVIFASPEQVRARKVVTRSRARSTGMFPSLKMRRMLEWESTNELNAMYLLECDPEVTEFREQPCKVRYNDGVEPKLHYPDLYVVSNGVKELWEVKGEAEAQRTDVIQRTALMAKLLRAEGYRYRQVLDRDLRRQPHLNNAKTIFHLGKRPVGILEKEGIRRVLAARGSLSWSEASSGLYGVRGKPMLCRLVLDGYLEFDRAQALSPETRFFARKAEQ